MKPALALADALVLQIDGGVFLEDGEGDYGDDQESHKEDAQAYVVNGQTAAGVLPGTPGTSKAQKQEQDAEGYGDSHYGFLGILDAGNHDVVFSDGNGTDDADDTQEEHEEGGEFDTVADELERETHFY